MSAKNPDIQNEIRVFEQRQSELSEDDNQEVQDHMYRHQNPRQYPLTAEFATNAQDNYP